MVLPKLTLGGENGLSSNSRAVLLGGGGIALILLVQFAVMPFVSYVRSLDRELVRARKDYAAMSSLTSELGALKRAESVASRAAAGQKDALFAHVEQLARQFGLQGKLESMRPSTRTVDENTVEDEVKMRLRGITQKQLLDLLYAVEYREAGLTVKALGLKKDKQRLLDVDIAVALQRPAS